MRRSPHSFDQKTTLNSSKSLGYGFAKLLSHGTLALSCFRKQYIPALSHQLWSAEPLLVKTIDEDEVHIRLLKVTKVKEAQQEFPESVLAVVIGEIFIEICYGVVQSCLQLVALIVVERERSRGLRTRLLEHKLAHLIESLTLQYTIHIVL
jgi:hypothetical protein